jgi:uncharacterized protein YdaU (DUF1376 family)
MSVAAEGAFTRLLDAQWETGHIPADPETCARVIRCNAQEWEQFAPFFETCFPTTDDGHRRNEELHLEREEAQKKMEKARETGREGGNRRWAKQRAKQEGGEEEDENEPKKGRNHRDPIGTLEQPHKGASTYIERELELELEDSVTNVTGRDGQAATARDDVGGINFEGKEDPSPGFSEIRELLEAISGGTKVPNSKVRQHLGKDSPLRGMIEQYGHVGAKRLLVWATTHKNLGIPVIWRNSETLKAEAERCNWGAPPERGRPKEREAEGFKLPKFRSEDFPDPLPKFRPGMNINDGPFAGIPDPEGEVKSGEASA